MKKKQFFKNMFTLLVYTNWPKMPSKKYISALQKYRRQSYSKA